MRDFHVSPAMGAEGVELVSDQTISPTASDQFKRIARLAMISKVPDPTSSSGPQTGYVIRVLKN